MDAEPLEVVTRSPEETRELGRRIGAELGPGSVLLLVGELGSGKTMLVKGIAEACGVTTTVRSPTFALVHRYRGSPDVMHVDLYREGDTPRLGDLDWEEGSDSVLVIEWPPDSGIVEDLWPGALRIELHHVDENTRRIRLPGRLRRVESCP